MKTKLEMAHDYVMNYLNNPSCENATVSSIVSVAWSYADAMQVEADKREDKKQAERIKIYADAFMNCEIQVIDEDGTCRITTRQKELDRDKWQPDWSQAPEWANFLVMSEAGTAYWHTSEPKTSGNGWIDGGPCDLAFMDFYHAGDWCKSLRKRPQ